MHLLGFYLMIEFGAFFLSMLSTILLYVQRSTLIDEVIDFNKDWDAAKKEEMKTVLNGNIKNVFIAMLFFTLILVSTGYPHVNKLAWNRLEPSSLGCATETRSRGAHRT